MLGRLTLTLGNSSLRLLRARHFRSFAQTRSRRSTWIIFALKLGWTQPGHRFPVGPVRARGKPTHVEKQYENQSDMGPIVGEYTGRYCLTAYIF